jgi:hypothetical protein
MRKNAIKKIMVPRRPHQEGPLLHKEVPPEEEEEAYDPVSDIIFYILTLLNQEVRNSPN